LNLFHSWKTAKHFLFTSVNSLQSVNTFRLFPLY